MCCVGGSTTVNWTSLFRTPSDTLAYWRSRFELPELDYPLNAFVLDSACRAFLSKAGIQFAAGAPTVIPVHENAQPYRSRPEARDAIGRDGRLA
jgi:hypothetical protein